MRKTAQWALAFFLLSCASSHKTGNLSFVTLDEEMTLGREIAIQTPNILRIIRNQEIGVFFNQLVKEVAAKSDWSGLGYTVYVVNDSAVNHFSLPGGEIYLTRGLVESAATAGELAGILSHEIAHIGRRDAVSRLATKYSYAFAAQSVIGQNPELAIQILQNLNNQATILDYPAKAEYLADALAIKYMWKANYDPNELLKLVHKVHDLEKSSRHLVQALRQTHPSSADRLQRIRRELASTPNHEALRQDVTDFKDIREQLMRIPR